MIDERDQSSHGRLVLKAIGLGALYMVVALVAQSIVQNLPAVIILSRTGFSTGTFSAAYLKAEIDNAILFSLFLGGIAGIAQEVSEYVAVDTMEKQYAIYIGAGFAVIDIIFLIGETLVSGAGLPRFTIILIGLNIILPFLLHPGTAAFMKWGRLMKRGVFALAISILIHAGVDGGLVYTDIYVIVHPAAYHTSAEIYWALAMGISVVIFLIGIRLLAAVREEVTAEPPVVY
ncbi:hypothetical protein ApAK_05235 [Thermoplasmatales archaeon AK]|nr:hypothetical protein [Thermoplasmatales archaeon AK]